MDPKKIQELMAMPLESVSLLDFTEFPEILIKKIELQINKFKEIQANLETLDISQKNIFQLIKEEEKTNEDELKRLESIDAELDRKISSLEASLKEINSRIEISKEKRFRSGEEEQKKINELIVVNEKMNQTIAVEKRGYIDLAKKVRVLEMVNAKMKEEHQKLKEKLRQEFDRSNNNRMKMIEQLFEKMDLK